MANLTCAQADALIAEAVGASCKSPREKLLLEIGILWQMYTLDGPVDITADLTSLTVDMTAITADQTQFN